MKNQTIANVNNNNAQIGNTALVAAFAKTGFKKFTSACVQKFNQLKERVAKQLTAEYRGVLNSQIVQQAVQEADALVAATAYPTLLLPALAEEKVRAASAWQIRQQAIMRRSELAFAA